MFRSLKISFNWEIGISHDLWFVATIKPIRIFKGELFGMHLISYIIYTTSVYHPHFFHWTSSNSTIENIKVRPFRFFQPRFLFYNQLIRIAEQRIALIIHVVIHKICVGDIETVNSESKKNVTTFRLVIRWVSKKSQHKILSFMRLNLGLQKVKRVYQLYFVLITIISHTCGKVRLDLTFQKSEKSSLKNEKSFLIVFILYWKLIVARGQTIAVLFMYFNEKAKDCYKRVWRPKFDEVDVMKSSYVADKRVNQTNSISFLYQFSRVK